MRKIKTFFCYSTSCFIVAGGLYLLCAVALSLPNPLSGAIGTGLGTGVVNGLFAAWTLR